MDRIWHLWVQAAQGTDHSTVGAFALALVDCDRYICGPDLDIDFGNMNHALIDRLTTNNGIWMKNDVGTPFPRPLLVWNRSLSDHESNHGLL
jgi:hypothetical protein